MSFCIRRCVAKETQGRAAGRFLTYRAHQREIAGGVPATTNNRMELKAAVEGLKALKESCEVEFFTDAQYVQNGISEWLGGLESAGLEN